VSFTEGNGPRARSPRCARPASCTSTLVWGTFDIDPERVREGCMQDVLALARIAEGASA
jgi:hypothetical protein